MSEEKKSKKNVSDEIKEELAELEKKKKRCEVLKNICETVSGALTTVGCVGGLCAAGYLGLVGGVCVGGAVGVAASLPTLAGSYIARKRKQNIEEKIDACKQKLDPDAYYKNLINDEKKILNQYEKTAEGKFSKKERNELTKEGLKEAAEEAKGKLRPQAEKIEMLEKSHSMAKQCGKQRTIRRLTDIMVANEKRLEGHIRDAGTHAVIAVGTLGMGVGLGALSIESGNPVTGAVMTSALLAIGSVAAYNARKISREEKAVAKSEGLLKRFVRQNNGQEKA